MYRTASFGPIWPGGERPKRPKAEPRRREPPPPAAVGSPRIRALGQTEKGRGPQASSPDALAYRAGFEGNGELLRPAEVKVAKSIGGTGSGNRIGGGGGREARA